MFFLSTGSNLHFLCVPSLNDSDQSQRIHSVSRNRKVGNLTVYQHQPITDRNWPGAPTPQINFGSVEFLTQAQEMIGGG